MEQQPILGTPLNFIPNTSLNEPMYRQPNAPFRGHVFSQPNTSLNDPVVIRPNTPLNNPKASITRKRNLRKELKGHHANWRAHKRSRKKIQRAYNREKRNIDRQNTYFNRLTNPSRWFKPRVVSKKNITSNFRPLVSKSRKKGIANLFEKKNIAQANIVKGIIQTNSEYEKIMLVEENLREFKEKQSEVVKNLYRSLVLSQDKFESSDIVFKTKKAREGVNIFGSIYQYNEVMDDFIDGRKISKENAGKLSEYYSQMKEQSNKYVLEFIIYITCALEFVISVLLWGFCLPNNTLSSPERILSLNTMINNKMDVLKYNIKEYKRRYQKDLDFNHHMEENLYRLYNVLKSLIGIKLVGKNGWYGEYITEDEIFRHCLDTIPSLTLIDDLQSYLTPITYKFPYDVLSPLETEIIKSVLLLKIKEKQPGTIHVDRNMVMPTSYWTHAITVEQNFER
jgi:hypothetical protein